MVRFSDFLHYRIEDDLGGSMSHVYRAFDTKASRPVVLKLIRDILDKELDIEAERNGAEVQKVMWAKDPRVPEVYEIGVQDGYFFVAMEYVEGEDLSKKLRKSPIRPDRSAKYVIEILQLIEKAHEIHVIHGDIKPGNIRITQDEKVRVLDFGIAKEVSMQRNSTKNPFRSTEYASPERIDDGIMSVESDLWSVGVTLYEMVSGQRPFKINIDPQRQRDGRAVDHEIERLIIKYARGNVPLPPLPSNCPVSLCFVIEKALAPELIYRYVTPAEFREDLERFLKGEPTLAEIEMADVSAANLQTESPAKRTPSRPQQPLVVPPAAELSRRKSPIKPEIEFQPPSPDATFLPAVTDDAFDFDKVARDEEREEQAAEKVDRFFQAFGEPYREMAWHAALPLVLTPELVNYIRTEFLLDQVGWVAEADLLLSDLCREVGYETYVLDEDVRALLLKQGREALGAQRMKEVAHRVYNYLSHVVYSSPLLTAEDLKAQRWEAMVYLDRHRETAAKEMADSFAAAGGLAQATPVAGGQPINWAELARIAHLVQGVREQLRQDPSGELARLVEYAAAASQIADLRAGFLHPSRLQLQNMAEQFEVMGTRLASPDALLEKARNEDRQREVIAREEVRDEFISKVSGEVAVLMKRDLLQLPMDDNAAVRIDYTILLSLSKEDDGSKPEDFVEVLLKFATKYVRSLIGRRRAESVMVLLKQSVDDVLPSSQINLRSSWSYAEDLGGGLMLEMVYVPGGEFLMGSEVHSTEQPIHRVTILPFFVGKYQVTQAQWRKVMEENPSRFKGDSLPVESVSWDDAVKFCQQLSSEKKTNRAYRLPSEAEWEYACRAGSTGKYCFGDDEKLLEQYAWYSKNSGNTTHPIGEKKANDFGLYDMHGNVWEWCEDVWHSNYNDSPTDGSAWLSGRDSSFRVLRGGSWSNLGNYCRSAGRDYVDDPGLRVDDFGFRVVVSVRTPNT